MHPPPARPGSGALVAAALFALPAAALASAHLPVAAAIAAFGILLVRITRHPLRFAGLCALPAVLAGASPRVTQPPVPRPGPVTLAGDVLDVRRNPRTGTTFVELGCPGASVRVRFDGDVEVLPGDSLFASGRIAAPAAPDLPPTVHAVACTAVVTEGPWSAGRAAAFARRTLERHLLRLVPGDRGAMLASLVLGRATRPSNELTAAHQATGLSHLLAVSGAHAAMLALLLGFRARAHRLDASRTRTAVAFVLLLAYAAITGNEPPVLRAVATFALASLAARTGRPLGFAPGLLAPAILTSLLQPDALLGPSFLLSYAAVAGLHAAGPSPPRSSLLRWLAHALRSSAWATLFTAPLTLFFFGQIAPWTVILTPLLAPLVATLLLGGLAIATIACGLPWLAEALAVPLDAATAVYVAAVEAADILPATPIQAWSEPAAWLVALCAGGALLVAERRRDRKGLVAAAATAMLPWFLPPLGAAPPRFFLFAVGHGQAALLIDPDGHQTVIDCGSLQQSALAARRVLARLERRRIDLLVVTHADTDHHDGVPWLLQRVPITNALLPRALASSHLASTLHAHGAGITFLGPGEHSKPAPHVVAAVPVVPEGSGDNDRSAWVEARLGTATILCAGDAEATGTLAALAQDLVRPADVLVLPHHGRPNAAAANLLRQVRPRTALASADGADGDTALGGIARSFGADVFVTGSDGTIELRATASPTGEPELRVVLPAAGHALRSPRAAPRSGHESWR